MPGDDDIPATILAMLDGFEMPRELSDPFQDLLASLPLTDGQRMVHVLARVDGEPAGAGSVVISDGVAGLHNIAVAPPGRRRGVGRAITLELMRLGARHGCGSSILLASQLGLPVYQKLGYEAVCETAQFLWTPGD